MRANSAVCGFESSRDLALVVEGNTRFALDLYQEFAKVDGNLFFSPYSISTVLAMTCAGARANTEAQMAQVLRFSLRQAQLHPAFAALEARLGAAQKAGSVQLRVANALWPQMGYDLLPDFLALTEAHYGAAIFPVAFGQAEAARKRINTWVEERTENKIVELIGPGILNVLTRLVLVSAIYFKGDWASQFDESLTEHAPFWITPTDSVSVPIMTQQATFGYGETESLQVLELPYAGGSLSMIVLLPRERDGLAALERDLTGENLAAWSSLLRECEVQVFLPRFKHKSHFELSAVLQDLGMRDAFNEERANLAGMDGRENWLFISDVLHQAFVDVNEEGAEAAAATAVVMEMRGLPPPPPVFRADHPFLFFIRENQTRSILFLGRIVQPRGEGG